MPPLTTATLLPWIALRRRDSTLGQRSSPFMVDAAPSVMESPNAMMAKASVGPSSRSHRGRTTTRSYTEMPLRPPTCPWIRTGCGDVGRRQRLGVPGHRAAFADDVKADREAAAGEVVGLPCERQRDGIAPDRIAGWDGDGHLAAKRHRAIGAAEQRRTATLQAGTNAVERHGLGAEGVAEPEAGLLAEISGRTIRRKV